MDIERGLKLAALGWDGKKDPLHFLITKFSQYNFGWEFDNGYLNVFWRSGKSSEMIFRRLGKNKKKKVQKDTAIEIMLRLFYTINGRVIGPNSEYLKDQPEWT